MIRYWIPIILLGKGSITTNLISLCSYLQFPKIEISKGNPVSFPFGYLQTSVNQPHGPFPNQADEEIFVQTVMDRTIEFT